jgi:hypothetical protein
VRWGGLFHLTGLSLTGSRTGTTINWAVRASLSIGGGATTTMDGSLTLRDGRATAGSLIMRSLSIGELVRIESLTISASDAGGQTSWAVSSSVAFGEGSPVTTQGTMNWARGTLTQATLRLGNAPIGELFRIDDFRITFEQGRRWTASGTVTDEDGTSTLAGALDFIDGRVSGGTLDIANLQLGPLELSTFRLTVGATGAPGPTVCGVADAAGVGTGTP